MELSKNLGRWIFFFYKTCFHPSPPILVPESLKLACSVCVYCVLFCILWEIIGDLITLYLRHTSGPTYLSNFFSSDLRGRGLRVTLVKFITHFKLNKLNIIKLINSILLPREHWHPEFEAYEEKTNPYLPKAYRKEDFMKKKGLGRRYSKYLPKLKLPLEDKAAVYKLPKSLVYEKQDD